jgi:GNAT superfamily N-acetyltransferase
MAVMHIRPFAEADYSDLMRLHNQTYGDFAKYADELRLMDARQPDYVRWARWMAIDSDESVVGFAEYRNSRALFDPRKFSVHLAVDQHRYGQGIGARLYQTVCDALTPLKPASLVIWTRADMPCRISFLARRGFEPDVELFTSGLDVRSFDAARWQPRLDDVESQGIQIRSLEALGIDDPSVRQNVYDLWREVLQDLPHPPDETPSPPISLEEYWDEMQGPGLLPSGYFLALDGECCVGTSQLFLSPLDGELRTGLTGVRRAYRRRGIALGLKVAALRYAQELGCQRVVTDNAAVNEGMLAINGALGFARNPVWTRYLKRLSGGAGVSPD